MVGLHQYTDEEIYFVLWYKVLGEHNKHETLIAFKSIFGTELTDTQLRYLCTKYENEPRFK
jgi:murein tripeptide amidase MpaA